MNIFFGRSLKIKSVLFVSVLKVRFSKILKSLHCCDIWLLTFFLLLWNYFLIQKILPVTHLRKLWSGNFGHENAYGDPPVVLKYQSGSRLGHVNLRRFFLLKYGPRSMVPLHGPRPRPRRPRPGATSPWEKRGPAVPLSLQQLPERIPRRQGQGRWRRQPPVLLSGYAAGGRLIGISTMRSQDDSKGSSEKPAV